MFLAIQIVIASWLLVYWWRYFLENHNDLAVYLYFCIFAFGMTLYLGIHSGNIAIIEQGLL
jgi:hypothetical protein